MQSVHTFVLHGRLARLLSQAQGCTLSIVWMNALLVEFLRGFA